MHSLSFYLYFSNHGLIVGHRICVKTWERDIFLGVDRYRGYVIVKRGMDAYSEM